MSFNSEDRQKQLQNDELYNDDLAYAREVQRQNLSRRSNYSYVSVKQEAEASPDARSDHHDRSDIYQKQKIKEEPSISVLDDDSSILSRDLGVLGNSAVVPESGRRDGLDDMEDCTVAALLEPLDLSGVFSDDEIAGLYSNDKDEETDERGGTRAHKSHFEDQQEDDDPFEEAEILDIGEQLLFADAGFWLESSDDPVASDTGNSEVIWSSIDIDLDEYQEQAGLQDDPDIEVDGQIARTERALQAAIDVSGVHGLDADETWSLTEIFDLNGWSACRTAINRELSYGTSVEELVSASEIRMIWQEHLEWQGHGTHYKILSWPMALSIIRSFEGYPQAEEVEQLLEFLHFHWSTDPIARRVCKSFGEYLLAKFSQGENNCALLCEWSVRTENYYNFGLFEE